MSWILLSLQAHKLGHTYFWLTYVVHTIALWMNSIHIISCINLKYRLEMNVVHVVHVNLCDRHLWERLREWRKVCLANASNQYEFCCENYSRYTQYGFDSFNMGFKRINIMVQLDANQIRWEARDIIGCAIHSIISGILFISDFYGIMQLV